MALKIFIILCGIGFLITFMFFEAKLKAFLKGRSKLFYAGLVAALLAALAVLHFVDFIYILLALAAFIVLMAALPYLVGRFYRR